MIFLFTIIACQYRYLRNNLTKTYEKTYKRMDFNIHHLKLMFYCFKHLMECDHRYDLVVFSSPKLNTQGRFSDRLLSVRPSVC